VGSTEEDAYPEKPLEEITMDLAPIFQVLIMYELLD